MSLKSCFVFLITLALSIHKITGQCEMENIDWRVPQRLEILDTFRGEFFARNTTGITGISGPIEITTALNGGPYLAVAHTGSRFSFTTTDTYVDYEERETAQQISITVVFNCEGTTDARLVFILAIKDTNNNDPIFRPDTYEFTVLPPLPPGFRITDCWNDIIARDIDLTTQRVEFALYETTSFEIAYDAELSTVPKEFHAMLKTTTFIRSIPEPIEFRISATDVDLTNDPSRTTYTTVRIKSEKEFELPEEIVFTQTFYEALYTVDQQVSLRENITLRQGYHEEVQFSLTEYSEYFSLVGDGNDVSINVDARLPSDLLSERQLIFAVEATRNLTSGASATIILQLPESVILRFEQTRYVGKIVKGSLQLSSLVVTSGYDLPFQLNITGDFSSNFALDYESNNVILRMESPLPPEVVENNAFILLDIEVSYSEAVSGVTAVFLELVKESSIPVPVFDQAYYSGEYSNETGLLFEQRIQLIGGFNESVLFNLTGDQSQWFDLIRSEEYAQVILRESNPIPPAVIVNHQQLLFVVTAQRPGSAVSRATIVITLNSERTSNRLLSFDRVTYVGKIIENSVNLDPIILSEGNTSDVSFTLHGDLQRYFRTVAVDGTVMLALLEPIAQEDIPKNKIILLNIEASAAQSSSAFATIVLEDDRNEVSTTPIPTLSEPIFAEAYYTGTYSQQNDLTFDIHISLIEGYDESVVFGLESDHSQWFDLERSENSVRIILRESSSIPPAIIASNQQLIFIVTAQRPGSTVARTTVIILLSHDNLLPEISFDSASYVIRVEIGQTGFVGSVRATTDNGETVTYSLFVDNEHLRVRISINTAGGLHLSAPANSGVYSFQVVATAASSQAITSAKVHLSVEALTVCGENTVIAPLIVLERNEEEPLRDLVLLNTTEHAGCQYSLTNRWPADQPWLYVDETGLHATAIDREDPSIAFMALSQVQVELILTCDSDVIRAKRSTSERLGAYNHGTSTWLIGETILFNPKRSFVNLIVNDINDNAPMFIGKESEPIVVGYPVPELKKAVLPRSLVELQATDADIGENAALVYWSSEPVLVVSATTGFVHVGNELELLQDQILTVNATDRNGQGHTGSITLRVKLLQSNNIAVITVRNAFLEDETHILRNVSNAIGYVVRALGSSVISGTENEEATRMTREVINTGAYLEVYVYGLIQNEPVDVNTLKADISGAAVITDNITSILSLEDHLEGLVIRDNAGRDTSLLAATIVLSALLFILIVAVIVWFILKRKKRQNYEHFSDSNSIASRNESLNHSPKSLRTVDVAKPKLNIEDLKRSERRLQDMLNAPQEVTFEGNSLNQTNSTNKGLLIEPLAPIIIQDKLNDAGRESEDEDEFGEKKKPRRKSIVTFNENVEKIIHLDGIPDKSDPIYEVYQL